METALVYCGYEICGHELPLGSLLSAREEICSNPMVPNK